MQAYMRDHKTTPVNKDPQRRGLHCRNFDTARGKRNRPTRRRVEWVNDSAVSATAWAAVAASLRGIYSREDV